MSTAYIALGSNLGDRAATLLAAVRELNATSEIRVARLSTFHDTEPIGGPAGQPRFLNAAAELSTTLGPEDLLATLLAIEQKFGRVRREKDGPRTLDLDLLLFDDLVRSVPDPIVPHPQMHTRRFVLAPLVEIAPAVEHPGLKLTVKEMLFGLEDSAVSPRPESSSGALSESAPLEDSGRGEIGPLALQGQRALVTGSTSGIGQAIALALAAAGADVIVHGHRSVEAAQAVAQQIASGGVRSHVLMADFRDSAAGRGLLEQAWDTWGGLDVCVFNAGADTLTGPAVDWSFERKFAELLAVDVTATILHSRAVGGWMKSQGHGTILTMGWDQAESGMEGDSGQLFGAAKGAVMAFTRSLAASLAPEVRVNCLAPGWIRTAWGEHASAVWQQRVRAETPLARWGTPEDVAAAAVWLASPAASFITGQIIRINGGAIRT